MLLLVPTAYAQVYNFHVYNQSNGIPSSSIKCLFQDSRNIIWIGTDGAGLVRHENGKFSVLDQTNGLDGTFITDITESPDHKIAIATQYAGIFIYDGSTFKRPPSSSHLNNTTILKVAYTTNGDLIAMNAERIFLIGKNKSTLLYEFEAPAFSTINSLHLDSLNQIWFGTNKGAYKFQQGKLIPVLSEYDDQTICVSSDVKGKIYLATQHAQVYLVDAVNKSGGVKLKKVTEYRGTEKFNIQSFFVSRSGSFWLGDMNNRGILMLNGDYAVQFNAKNGFNGGSIECFLQDKSHNLYVATSGYGLFIVGPQLFMDYSNINGLNTATIFALCKNQTGNKLYVGVQGEGVLEYSYGSKNELYLSNKFLSSDISVHTLFCDNKNQILVGTGNGLYILNGKPKLFLEGNKIVTIKQDEKGHYLFGTHTKGLIITNPQFEIVKSFGRTNSPLDSYVSTIDAVDANTWYVGSTNGLFVLHTAPEFRLDEKPILEDVIGISTKDSYGNFWFSGTKLNVVTKQGIFRYDKKNGITSTLIYTLVGDGQGHLWAGSNLGIDKITVTQSGRIQSVNNYNASNGFTGLETNMRAQFVDSAGNMYLGTGRGLMVGQIGYSSVKHIIPNIYLSSIEINGKRYQGKQSNKWYHLPANGHPFKSNENDLTFEYGVNNLDFNETVYYSHKLMGYTNKWSKPTSEHKISFSNLPYGQYTFHLRLTTSSGIPIGNTYHFDFSIQAPYYYSTWFIALMILFTLGLLLLIFIKQQPFEQKLISRFSDSATKPEDFQLYALVMAILFPITELFIELLHLRPQSEMVGNLSCGLFLLMVYIGSQRNRMIYTWTPRILQVFFILFTVLNFYKISTQPLDPILFSEFLTCVFIGYPLLQHIRYYYYFVVLLAIGIVTAYLCQLISAETVVIISTSAIIIAALNFVRHKTYLKTREKFVFVHTAINKGKSILIAANENNEIVYVSDNVKNMLGFNPEAILGNGWFEKTFDDLKESNQMKALLAKSTKNNETYTRRVKTNWGTYKWIQWQDTYFDDTKLMVGIGLDVTEHISDQLKYQNLVQSANDIIYESDHKGNFTFVNDFVQNALGYEPNEILGKHFTSLIVNEDLEKVSAFYKNLLPEQGTFQVLDFRVKHKNNSVVWVSQKVTVLRDAGEKITGYNAIVRDITAAKMEELRKEQLQTKLSLQNNVLGKLSKITIENYAGKQQVYEYILLQVTEALKIERATYWEIDNDLIKQVLTCDRGNYLTQTNFSYSLDEHVSYYKVLARDGVVNAQEARANLLTREFTDEYFKPNGIFATLDVPIHQNGTWIGVLCCESRDEQQSWLTEDESFARSVAEIIANVNENYKRKEAEQAVIISERNFRQITNAIEDVYYLYNVTYKQYEFISPKILDLFGYTNQEFTTGKIKSRDMIHKDDLDLHNKAIDQIESGELKMIDITYRVWVNNQIKWINEKAFGIETSKVYLTSGVCRDITEAKLNEEKIRQLSLVAEKTSNGIVIAEEDGKVIWANQSYLDMFEIPLEKLIGNYPKFLFSKEDDQLHGKIEELNKTQKGYTLEIASFTYLGKPIWIELITTPFIDNNGKVIQVEVINNISERKNTEQKIKELSLVAEKTTNGVLISDKEGKVIWANKGYLDILEIQLDDIIGKRPLDVFSPNDHQLQQDMAELNSTNFEREIKVKTFKGRVKWLRLNNTIVLDDAGDVKQQIEVVTDVTDKVEKAEQLKKYADEQLFENLFKSKLIQAGSVEEITRIGLSLFLHKFTECNRISLFSFDKHRQNLTGYSYFNGETKKSGHKIADVKSIKFVQNGDYYIEHDLINAKEKSISDYSALESGVRSYIIFPIFYNEELLGTLNMGFATVFPLSLETIYSIKQLVITLGVIIKQIELQTILIDKNKDIVESLNYAQTIQKSILPNLNSYSDILTDVVLMFEARDIVSGDFYWARETKDHLFIALADCTGHGVPGAFLTIIGSRMLEQIVMVEGESSPGKILQKLDNGIYHALNAGQPDLLQDGMEIALCVIDKRNSSLTFAGAGMGLLYFKDNEEMYVKSRRKAIGDLRNETFEFEEINFPLVNKQRFYMATDGYQDQLGGVNYKRFSKKAVFDLLKATDQLPAEKQLEILTETHLSHKGIFNQTDDISILGFTILTTRF